MTAIISGAVDGNRRTDGDPAWAPLVTTPAFPSYPSAHASASYAARLIAEWLFGRKGIHFQLSHPGVPGVLLTYRSFHDLPHDVDDALVYGGIHFRFEQVAGAWQGDEVGGYILLHQLRRLRRRGCRPQVLTFQQVAEKRAVATAKSRLPGCRKSQQTGSGGSWELDLGS